MSERPHTEETAAGPQEPAVEILHVSKRYGRGVTRRDAEPVEDIDDIDEIDDEEPEAEPVPAERGTGWALQDVSLTVQPGSSLGLIGPNGAGKTTLLKVLARITPPTDGRVLLRGWVAPMIESASSLMQGELSGRRNVWLLSRFFGVPRHLVERQMEDIVAFAELETRIDDKAKTYSSGAYRRLAFSVVLNLEPDILLADEVLAVGDLAFRQRCIELVESRRQAGMTMLFASHDLDLTRRLCDDVAWLEQGRIVGYGDVEDVCRDYERSLGIFRGALEVHAPEQRSAGRKDIEHAQRYAGVASARRWSEVARSLKSSTKSGFNEHAAVISGGLFSLEGALIGTMRVDEPVVLKMLVEVATPGTSLQCTIVLQAKGRTVLKVVQPEPFVVPQAGSYVASVSLPRNALPEAFYTVRIGAWVMHEDRRWPLTRADAFSIDAYVPDGADDAYEPDDGGAIEDETGVKKRTDLRWSIANSTTLAA